MHHWGVRGQRNWGERVETEELPEPLRGIWKDTEELRADGKLRHSTQEK